MKNCKLVRCSPRFGPSSIDCEFVYDDRTRDPDTLAGHKSAIILGVSALSSGKNRLRLPDAMTFTAAPDGTLVMPYPQIQPVAALDEKAKASAQGSLNLRRAAAPSRGSPSGVSFQEIGQASPGGNPVRRNGPLIFLLHFGRQHFDHLGIVDPESITRNGPRLHRMV